MMNKNFNVVLKQNIKGRQSYNLYLPNLVTHM